MTFCVSTECRGLLVTFPLFLFLLFIIFFTCSASQICRCPLNRGHIAFSGLLGFALELEIAVCVCESVNVNEVQHRKLCITLKSLSCYRSNAVIEG